eukprot:6206715-Pyramimonas_sp.AAC.1
MSVASVLLGDFDSARGDEGRAQAQQGTFTRGGTAHSRKLSSLCGDWAELRRPLDTRRARQGPLVAGAARLDR